MKRISYTVEFFQDIDRARKIASILYNQFSTKSGFFRGYEMPEYIPPKGLKRDSKEYALYLTYVIAIDFQTNAVKLWKNARELYEENPLFFDSETISNLSVESVRDIVKSLGARYPSGGASGWKEISRILLEKYGGDPRNITDKPLTLKELRRRLQEFPYLRGKKLNTFYIRAMGENGLLKIKDFDNLCVAVDIQVALTSLLKPDIEEIVDKKIGERSPTILTPIHQSFPVPTPANAEIVKNLPSYERQIHDYLDSHRGIAFTRYQVATALKIGPKSSRFTTALTRLEKLKLIDETREGLKVHA